MEDQDQKIESCYIDAQTDGEVTPELSECSTEQPEHSEEGD